MYLNLKTEFTFKAVYGHLDQLAKKCAEHSTFGGIADIGNTFGHIRWAKACKKAGIKPIYGVKLPVLEDPNLKERRIPVNSMTFIAKTQKGLQDIYKLVELAHDQFYYTQRISYDQLNELSELDVAILSGVAPRWDLINRHVFQEVGPHINKPSSDKMVEPIAAIDNYYPDVDDKAIYEPFADARAREAKTYPLHIWSYKEWLVELPKYQSAIDNMLKLASECNVELPEAPMVRYIGDDDMLAWCHKGAKEKGINLQDGKYAERYKREIQLIEEKDYTDYFLVVADLIRYAKTKMSVGPARGSSAGSLVCYLMGITEIDPLEYDLYFERFIDVNRFDLPDIDIDFQDDKRHLVNKYLEKKYGRDCVATLGNINRLKPKSAITRFAQALNIPLDDVEEFKDSIMDRSGGDARANNSIEDTIQDTDVGKRFIEKYPKMNLVAKVEAHASHSGVHAAGILVCNEPITKYAGVNTRDNKRVAMLDKKDAEQINLLKIDALGLRTLSILASVCDQIGKPYSWLYEIPVDDPAAYDVFNNHRYNGIFQFEGPAIKGLAKNMPVENMEDIAALGALGRPGPLNSGGANRFLKFRSGKEAPRYMSNHPAVVKATENTFGIVVYQEQMLMISREYGQLSWADTSDLRRAASKSLGDEFFGKYKAKFIEGALSIGETLEDAESVWSGINTMGCLSGDTVLRNPFPNHATPKEITLKELCENEGFIRKPDNKFVNGPRSDSKKEKWQMMKRQQLYCMVGDKIKPRRLIDVFESGVKTTYELQLDTGEKIRATLNHRFYTESGWAELGNLEIGAKIAVMGKTRKGTKNKPFRGTGSGAHNNWHGASKKYLAAIDYLNKKYSKCSICRESPYEETHHKDGNRLNNELINLQPLCRKCHKKIHVEKDGQMCIPHRVGKDVDFSQIIFIGEPREEMTYDISMPDPDNNFIANNIVVHNSWAFNKSHAVSYGLISYLCAYMKGNYPLEFTVACLNNAKEDNSALKILRDAVENDGVEYIHIDKDISEKAWSVHGDKLYGGLKTIHGIGPKMADKVIKCRKTGEDLPKGIRTKLDKGSSAFKYLYPAKQVYGDFYTDPKSHGLTRHITKIAEIQGDGDFVIIGKMIKKNLRDANEACFVSERGGSYETGQTAWLNITIEDDTESIMCKIQKKDYERFGREIAESGKEDKDWYAVFGSRINGWSLIFVKNIAKITREV